MATNEEILDKIAWILGSYRSWKIYAKEKPNQSRELLKLIEEQKKLAREDVLHELVQRLCNGEVLTTEEEIHKRIAKLKERAEKAEVARTKLENDLRHAVDCDGYEHIGDEKENCPICLRIVEELEKKAEGEDVLVLQECPNCKMQMRNLNAFNVIEELKKQKEKAEAEEERLRQENAKLKAQELIERRCREKTEAEVKRLHDIWDATVRERIELYDKIEKQKEKAEAELKEVANAKYIAITDKETKAMLELMREKITRLENALTKIKKLFPKPDKPEEYMHEDLKELWAIIEQAEGDKQ